MNTLRYLTDPSLRDAYWPAVVVGLGIALMCSVLSVLAVLKRSSFIGQGISHAAFGGVGIAAYFGLSTSVGPQLAIVLGFCLGCAWVIARLSDRRSTSSDTAIGIVLVGSMTLGAILLHLGFQRAREHGWTAPPNWESILFGSIWGSWADAGLAWAVAIIVLGTLWGARRPLLFWAFDEPAAPAFGVPSGAMKLLLMALLTLAIVASMKLAGVVLATALLVLPGASALQLSDRLWRVVGLSGAIGALGVLGGLVLGFEFDLPPGPGIVAMLTAVFAVAKLVGVSRHVPPPRVPPGGVEAGAATINA